MCVGGSSTIYLSLVISGISYFFQKQVFSPSQVRRHGQRLKILVHFHTQDRSITKEGGVNYCFEKEKKELDNCKFSLLLKKKLLCIFWGKEINKEPAKKSLPSCIDYSASSWWMEVEKGGKSNRPTTSQRCREHVVPCYFRGRRAENDIEGGRDISCDGEGGSAFGIISLYTTKASM